MTEYEIQLKIMSRLGWLIAWQFIWAIILLLGVI